MITKRMVNIIGYRQVLWDISLLSPFHWNLSLRHLMSSKRVFWYLWFLHLFHVSFFTLLSVYNLLSLLWSSKRANRLHVTADALYLPLMTVFMFLGICIATKRPQHLRQFDSLLYLDELLRSNQIKCYLSSL